MKNYNTIEDFTDDKEIIEIEKLMFDKKYDEALKKAIIHLNKMQNEFESLNLQQQEESIYKSLITGILFVICYQYIDLYAAIHNLNVLNNRFEAESLGILLLFNDILQKMKNGYYEKQQTKMGNEYIAAIKLTPKDMINKIENQIQKILKKNTKNLLGYIPTKEESTIKYLFNKFQK